MRTDAQKPDSWAQASLPALARSAGIWSAGILAGIMYRRPPGRLIVFAAAMFSLLSLTACRQDMHDQAKYEPLEQSQFWGDDRSSRPVVEGTVARGQLREDTHLYTGKEGTAYVTEFPLPVTTELMARGQQRFNIYCTPCHDTTGSGNGMIVQRGFKRPPSYHIDRLRQAPVGYFYDVITNGFGAMAGYADQVPVRDRWAIVAYVRALQLSQHATTSDVPESERQRLEAVRKP
ncbi:MAG TPA: cytochrome c [Acidobacteriota bacterium]|nr:cytochrome c [Acidobacteriota bacterium]